MNHYKTHYQVIEYGGKEAREQWMREGLTLDKVKFCDGLMLTLDRQYDFTKDTEGVDCKKCLRKIEIWCQNHFDLPL